MRASRRRVRRGGARPAGARGFTLVELVISLVAGLMVATAVMAVSKEATNTFHEEVRVSSAEMGVRIAMERLRMDLQRAAFMSTGNIVGDPLVARKANVIAAAGTILNLSNVTAPPLALKRLAGIALHSGGAEVVTDTASSAQMSQNNLAPDTIDIGGNFSSADEYVAAILWPSAGSTAQAPCAAGPAISLQMNTPAAWRILNAETVASAQANYTAGDALQAAFHPGTSKTSQFLLRLTDQSGRYQYLVGAAGGTGKGTVYKATPASFTVCIDASSTILKVSDTGGLGGVSGYGAGWVVVSPVQVVQWDIQTLAAAYPSGTTSPYFQGAIPSDPKNYVLTRSYVDFSAGATAAANPVGEPVDTTTTEIVAEYAVDLKFGVTYDSFTNPSCTAFPCPITAPSYTTNPLVTVSMDNATALAANAYTFQSSTIYAPNVGPQRIRDVQVRLGVRSQYPDRVVNLPPPAASSYIYRYQIPAAVTAGSNALAFARVRENTSEVSLPNQARLYW